jgi:hypothetical protein
VKVRNFMLAEAISGSDGYHFIHGAGFTGLNVQGFPYVHPRVGLYLKLVREPEDAAGPHRLKVELVDPNSQVLGVLAESRVDLPQEHDGDDPLCVTYVGYCAGLQFPQPGSYWVTLSLDAQELDRLSVMVGAQRQGPGA